MGKFVKLPVEIEAFKTWANWFIESCPDNPTYPEWLQDAIDDGAVYLGGDMNDVFIKTLEGEHKATDGDYIIQGIKGELYPCKPDIFEASYKPVRTTELSYSEALVLMKDGKKLTRKHWNVKGLWVEMQFPDEHSKMTKPYLFMNAPNGTTDHWGDDADPVCDRVPWRPSNTDENQNDWEIVEV